MEEGKEGHRERRGGGERERVDRGEGREEREGIGRGKEEGREETIRALSTCTQCHWLQ